MAGVGNGTGAALIPFSTGSGRNQESAQNTEIDIDQSFATPRGITVGSPFQREVAENALSRQFSSGRFTHEQIEEFLQTAQHHLKDYISTFPAYVTNAPSFRNIASEVGESFQDFSEALRNAMGDRNDEAVGRAAEKLVDFLRQLDQFKGTEPITLEHDNQPLVGKLQAPHGSGIGGGTPEPLNLNVEPREYYIPLDKDGSASSTESKGESSAKEEKKEKDSLTYLDLFIAAFRLAAGKESELPTGWVVKAFKKEGFF